MRYSILPVGIVIICVIIMAGCASKYHPRTTPTFDYTPESEAPPGSAGVTFAVIGTPSWFGPAMTKDFLEVVIARGFGVRGPFETYDSMIFPDKEGSDLTLTAEVVFTTSTDTWLKSQMLLYIWPTGSYFITGSATVGCDVNLLITESLSNEPMWRKTITIEPVTIPIESSYAYRRSYLVEAAAKLGKSFRADLSLPIPIEVLLEEENKFHADVGHALQIIYDEILGKFYDYLDPREMEVVKNQSLVVRNKKVY